MQSRHCQGPSAAASAPLLWPSRVAPPSVDRRQAIDSRPRSASPHVSPLQLSRIFCGRAQRRTDAAQARRDGPKVSLSVRAAFRHVRRGGLTPHQVDRGWRPPHAKTGSGRKGNWANFWRLKRDQVAGKTHQLERDKERIVDDKGPFAAIAIGGNTKEDGADRAEHENEGDAPGDVRLGLVKGLGQAAHGEGDGEEVKGVPGLRQWR